jgi:hypothetical protein
MKALFYTRLEGNTGGDEALLNVFKEHMLKNIPEKSEIHLCISYDEISKERTEKVKKIWQDELKKKNVTGEVWLFLTKERSLEKSIPGIRNKYVEFKKANDNTLTALDTSIDWYIHETESGKYYLLRSGTKPNKKLELPETGSSLKLTAKTCFFSRERSSNPSEYPLLVLTEEARGDKRELAYYKDMSVTSPEIFPVVDNSKKFQSIVKELDKKSQAVLKLTDTHLNNLRGQFGFLPKEVLLTNTEMQQIRNNLEFPNEVLNQLDEWDKFKNLTCSLDTFVFAGWAHLQNQLTAKHLKKEFELRTECKILLGCVPGMSINGYGFVTGLTNHTDFKNVHVLQTGIKGNGGFPMMSKLTKEAMLDSKTRQAWLNHIGKGFEENVDPSGKKRMDKLIVIYCSKDAPDVAGMNFLQKTEEKLRKAEERPENWPVILVGTNTESEAYAQWERVCKLRSFPVFPIARTEVTEILMRGLHDAKYAMATGSYSILEARYLGIGHCKYLAPPHMRILTAMLDEAKKEKERKPNITEEEGIMHQTFVNGKTAGEELSKYLSPNCNNNFFDRQHAWSITDADALIEFITTAKNKAIPRPSIELSSQDDNHEVGISYGNSL